MDSDIVTYFSSDMGLNTINLNNANLDVDNFDDYDPETINHVRLMTWYNRLIDISNIKHVKKTDEELVPVVWHSTRTCDWSMSQNQKNRSRTIFFRWKVAWGGSSFLYLKFDHKITLVQK